VATAPLALRSSSAIWGHFGKGDLEEWLWHYWWTQKLAGFFAAEGLVLVVMPGFYTIGRRHKTGMMSSWNLEPPPPRSAKS
jgi:hypothetical protein